METSPLAAKTDPVPPPTGWAAAWRHITNWLEGWLWVPLSLLSIYGFAQFAYWLTGRRPTENVDWIVGLGGNSVKCVFAILFVSILRQSSGTWFTKVELLANPKIAWSQDLTKCVSLIVFAWVVSH